MKFTVLPPQSWLPWATAFSLVLAAPLGAAQANGTIAADIEPVIGQTPPPDPLAASQGAAFTDWLWGRRDAPPESGQKPTITRGPGLCWVAPVAGVTAATTQVYGRRPVFVLKGRHQGISVSAVPADRPLWTAPASEGVSTLHYNGETSLQPGNRYRLEAITPWGQALRTTFTLMSVAERDLVGAELADLDAAAIAAGLSEEARSLERANYFWQRNLPVDAWGEIAHVAASSDDAQANLEAGVDALCTPASTAEPLLP